MPPRYKFTREEILKTALNIARKKGIESVTARAVGAELGASSKVIFSLFGNMQTLHEELIKAAYSLYWQFVKEDTTSGKYLPYKASGMAYIRFAKEETELFKLLFMRDRSDEASTSVVADKDDLEMENIYRIISKANGFSLQQAK